ncbi:hypothetical protein [Treponema brennaborense]|uniref:Flagellar hook capping protein n=1 Tax=Treponema brennaborense (strain DSM 12168 / CIP 105900 / DD5/3) TaxID=906968 RepID=F4LKL5_TREBD|nr:hypothetical protein [Treponema brennaborense]AEE17571.1 flagellar hook capping protein [Treponema brennaborense DSM 12168]
MKKQLLHAAAVLFAAVLLCSAGTAEGYINANDLEAGTLTETERYEDGFVVSARADKTVVVDTAADGRTAPDGEVFTQRIKLGGTGTAEYRSILFPVQAGETVTIYLNSSSAADARMLVFANAAGDVVATITAPADVKGELKSGMESVAVPAAGDYMVYSKSGGINIYQITVTAK